MLFTWQPIVKGFYHCRTQVWIQVSEDATQPMLSLTQGATHFFCDFVDSMFKDGDMNFYVCMHKCTILQMHTLMIGSH